MPLKYYCVFHTFGTTDVVNKFKITDIHFRLVSERYKNIADIIGCSSFYAYKISFIWRLIC